MSTNNTNNTNTVEDGSTVQVHYTGTLNDGTVFDSSYTRDKPIDFQVGSGMMIPGFNNAVVGMSVGEKKKVSLTPDEAYGAPNPDAISEVPKLNFPNDFEFITGQVVQGSNEAGQPVVGTINEIKDDVVIIDFNHPMAGKDLNFEIEVVSIQE